MPNSTYITKLLFSRLKLINSSVTGFTLVELVIVIAVLGVVTTVGITRFTGVRDTALDAKRKADIDAIAGSYESKYNFKTKIYSALQPSDFGGNAIPTDSNGGSYNFVFGPNASPAVGSYFKVCTTLEGNAVPTCSNTSATCYCKSSVYGVLPTPTPTSINVSILLLAKSVFLMSKNSLIYEY